MDLANLSFKPDKHAIPIFKQTINIDSNFYPERLGAFFIINAPWIFKSLWALVRPWLDARTQRKFHVLGSDYAARLREFISEDQLPEEYGGTNPAQVSPASMSALAKMQLTADPTSHPLPRRLRTPDSPHVPPARRPPHSRRRGRVASTQRRQQAPMMPRR